MSKYHIVVGEIDYALISLLLTIITKPITKKAVLVVREDNKAGDLKIHLRNQLRALARKDDELLSVNQLNKFTVYSAPSDTRGYDYISQVEKLFSAVDACQYDVTTWELGADSKTTLSLSCPQLITSHIIKKSGYVKAKLGSNIKEADNLLEKDKRKTCYKTTEFNFANLISETGQYVDAVDSPLNRYIFSIISFSKKITEGSLKLFLPKNAFLLFSTFDQNIKNRLFNESFKQSSVEAINYQLKISLREFITVTTSAIKITINFLDKPHRDQSKQEYYFNQLIIDSGLCISFDEKSNENSKVKHLESNAFLQKINRKINSINKWYDDISIDAILFAKEKKHLSHMNFAERILAIAEKLDMNKNAICHSSGDLKYSELKSVLNQCVCNLLNSKIETGTRVAIVATDSSQFVIVLLSLIYIGCTVIIINPLLKLASIVNAINSAKIDSIIGDVEFLSLVSEDTINQLQATCLSTNLEELVNRKNTTPIEWTPAYTRPLDFAIGMFTSGTTGKPKLILHRHQDFIVAAERYAAQVLNLNASDRTLSLSRMSFSFGLHNVFNALYHGATTILPPKKLAVENIVQTIKCYQPSVLYAVPTVYQFLLAHESLQENDLKKVRCLVSAGDRLPAELNRKFQIKFGLPILDSLGSTEAYSTYLTNIPGHESVRGATGKIIPGFDAKIINEKGAICSCGEIGTLWLKGPALLSRYENDADITDLRFKDGWYCTNDMFERDRSGFYYYFGRADDVIKVSGQWVSPQEIENVLLEHPDVIEAAVVPIGDSETTTRPKTFVVTNRQDHKQLVGELKDFVKEKLECWKYPHLIQFVNELPKTVTGKLQRHQLRDANFKSDKVLEENYVASN
ncbi:AMP-binding protein [Aliikangiella sp. IMCC44359]|uniref:AMP-binding protein n=1 Tax=Aliikangiella sp. IMCC44359 TaxID=3459125 RepID=UPI00403AD9DB